MQRVIHRSRIIRGLLMFAFCSFQLASIAWANASSGGVSGANSDLSKDEGVRAKFEARLGELADLSKEKERWLLVYISLENEIDKAENVLRKIENKPAKDDNSSDMLRHSNRIKIALSQMIGSYRGLQDLAVRQCALVGKLETLDQSLKEKMLSRAEYASERMNLLSQIGQIEQLRLLENMAGDMSYLLKEIADEIQHLKFAFPIR